MVEYTTPQTPDHIDPTANMQGDAQDDAQKQQQFSDKTALKLRGLPYSVTDEDIVQFFHGVGMIEDSVKIGKMESGKLTGEACVLFETAEDCRIAYNEKNRQYIGSRFIELFRVPATEHESFNQDQLARFDRSMGGGRGRGGDMFESRGRGGRGRGGRGRGYQSYDDGADSGYSRGGYQSAGYSRGGGNSQQPSHGGYEKTNYEYSGNAEPNYESGPRFKSEQHIRLSDYITDDNRNRCLKMRGLPYSADVRQIRDFFGDFRVAERDVIIDKSHGQPTGYALVILENEEEAQRAKKALDRQYVGHRYVDVFFPDSRR